MSLDSARLEKIRAWLLLRLRELSDGVSQGLDELASEGHHLADLEELAGDVSAEGVVFEQFRSSADTIGLIEKALERLDEGNYEICEGCEGAIGEERLDALPFASQCISCKRKEEEQQSATL